MELIDTASDEAKQVAVRTTGAGARAAFHVAVKVVGGSAGAVVHVGGGAAVAALRSIRDAAKAALHEQRTTGKISVRDFGRTITGTREVVDIDDQAVARELETTLKRYGVTFAIEHGTDGTRTFHVQGKDVQVVEHALSVASERIDQKIARNATRRHNAEKIEEGVAAKKTEREQKQTRTKERGLETPTPKIDDEDGPSRSGVAR